MLPGAHSSVLVIYLQKAHTKTMMYLRRSKVKEELEHHLIDLYC